MDDLRQRIENLEKIIQNIQTVEALPEVKTNRYDEISRLRDVSIGNSVVILMFVVLFLWILYNNGDLTYKTRWLWILIVICLIIAIGFTKSLQNDFDREIQKLKDSYYDSIV